MMHGRRHTISEAQSQPSLVRTMSKSILYAPRKEVPGGTMQSLTTPGQTSNDFAHTAQDFQHISSKITQSEIQKEYEERMASKMESLRHLFRIGTGPSSSHTMGPRRAAQRFKKRYPDTQNVRVTLYGSLALTGKGHLTDVAIIKALEPMKTTIVWEPTKDLKFGDEELHNGMCFEALDGSKKGAKYECFSIGGGALLDSTTKGGAKGTESNAVHEIYPYSNFTMILEWVMQTGRQLWQYVDEYEPATIWDYLRNVWKTMKSAVERGLHSPEAVLPGVLHTPRRAHSLYMKSRHMGETYQRNPLLMAYAMAVSEENASGGIVVTAPTCGACGVVPACLYFMQTKEGYDDVEILHALAIAGLLGNLIKANGSISGAECGCQAEIGSACSMAAGALTFLMGGTPFQIGHAAAIAMEHCLGLTCDPCEGLVQVPCIERNAFYACKAFNAAELAILEDGRHPISFDEVIFTMYLTGKALREEYRETSLGGLAKAYNLDEQEDGFRIKSTVRKHLVTDSERREVKAAEDQKELMRRDRHRAYRREQDIRAGKTPLSDEQYDDEDDEDEGRRMSIGSLSSADAIPASELPPYGAFTTAPIPTSQPLPRQPLSTKSLPPHAPPPISPSYSSDSN